MDSFGVLLQSLRYQRPRGWPFDQAWTMAVSSALNTLRNPMDRHVLFQALNSTVKT